MADHPRQIRTTATGNARAPRVKLPQHETDVIASIISDLASDCDIAFSRPPSNYRTPRASYSSHSLRQEDLDAIQPRGRGMASISSFEMDQRARGRQWHAIDSEEISPVTYQSSRRSSFSRPTSERHQDSATSLIRKDKRVSTKSHLNQAQSADDEPEEAPENESTPKYPSAAKTAVIMISLYISIFLVALDRTIMGPAIPAITNKFNSIDDIGWYGSAYMLTSAGFILLYGRIYTFFPTKPIFLSGIFLFEAGSAVCGAAQSSIMLIIGRAIAGLGSSGIFTGAILIMLNTVPLHRRPLLQGLFGACFGVASVAGPLLGGAFTGSKLTWRWCFYINLPLGAITILVVILLLHLDEQKPTLPSWKSTLLHLDPLGTLLFLPSITSLLLALEWGAAEYSWSSPRLIALLTTFAVLFLAFLTWQFATRTTTATIPLRILQSRSVTFGSLSQFAVGATMLTVSIYIPLWFQAIKHSSPLTSGIQTIPLVLSVVVGSISSGGLVQKIGYYTPFMIAGACLMATGTGLLTNWSALTPPAQWIGYQVVLGLGVGFTMQHPNLAVQIVLPRHDVAVGTALLSLAQTLGGAVFAAVGQNLYIARFSAGVSAIPGVDVGAVLAAGATSLTDMVDPSVKGRVLEAYNGALTKGTFVACIGVACFAVPAALGMEWRSVKEEQRREQGGERSAELKKDGRGNGSQVVENVTPSASASAGAGAEKPVELKAPVPAWKKMYRPSGRFSTNLTAKINPDLRSELKKA